MGGNLSWGMQFRTCKNFWDSAGFSLAFIPKILTNTKATPPLLRLLLRYACKSYGLQFCESQNLGTNQTKNADSTIRAKNAKSNIFCHSERSEESKNNPSLRANPQDLRGNPPIEKIVELQKIRLPRSPTLARNDEILDSSLRLRSAQNDKLGLDSADFPLDSAIPTQEANSSIFDEKSGLCSCERGNRTDEFIDEASNKSPRFIAKRRRICPRFCAFKAII